MSGGERAKVLLTKLMLAQSNFLMLDEPTNHLDIISCEALQNALSEYEGTLLIVSHDRYLINSLADRIFYLTPTGIEIFEGNYDDFLDKFKPFAKPVQPEKERVEKQIEYKNKKERDALKRKTKARVAKIEIEISELEDKLNNLGNSLNNPEISCDYEKTLELTNQIDETQRTLDSLYQEWEKLNELLGI